MTKKVKVIRKKKSENLNIWIFATIILAAAVLYLLFTPANINSLTKDLDVVRNTIDNNQIKEQMTSLKESLLAEQQKDIPPKQEIVQENLDENPKEISNAEPISMEFYVMSQCPYGTQVINSIIPVKKTLGDKLDLSIDFILYPEDQYAGQEANYCVDGLCSMHGIHEVMGDIAELCAMKYSPDNAIDMILCMNKNAKEIPNNWEDCAEGLDIDSIKACYNGEEGKELLKQSNENSIAKHAQGSPTIFLNGKPYNQGRSELDFLRAICKEADYAFSECADVPKPIVVDTIVLNSKECADCDSSNIVKITEQIFPGSKIRYVDVNDEEGKALVKELGIEVVPAYIFSSKITETTSWKEQTQIQTAFEKKGDYYKLLDSQTGANYFIDEKARAAFEERQRLAQKEALAKLEEGKKLLNLSDDKPQLDFFVMSFCPYGMQAETGIIPVEEVLKDEASFVPHYVIYPQGQGCLVDEDGNKYCSLHGKSELDEDIRQMCIKDEQEEKLFPYLSLITNAYNAKELSTSNIESKWKDYATEAGVDIEMVEACFNDEARVFELLKAETNLNMLLGVRGSPTVFINGESYQGGRTPDAYLNGLCSQFEIEPEGCQTDFKEVAAAPATGSCG